MDLRNFGISKETADEAFAVMDYQPFVIDDDRHTGVAYSWLHTSDARSHGYEEFRFDRRTKAADVYETSLRANRMLAATYDNFIDVIAQRVPGGSFLDVSCNNGYFPVLASLKGCSRAVGIDPYHAVERRRSIEMLNEITGAQAEFRQGGYHFDRHLLFETPDGINAAPIDETFDIVSNSAFMCHTGQPLHFLATLARHARKALFVYSGFTDDDDYLIRFNPPYATNVPVPHCFNDGTALSTKLFVASMRVLGFPTVERIAPPAFGVQDEMPLSGISRYGAMRAFLCLR